MTDFIVRIELHREPNYEPLHAATKARGLKRFITAGTGIVYKLPTGVYCVQNSNASRQTVHDAADNAAKAVGHHNAAVLVVESGGCLWSGLEEATPYEQRMGA